jgi:hypothetical protein
MLNATFCLQPGGDTPSRKAMVDSLLLGCIPVLFSPVQLHLWPWHWDTAHTAVYVDGDAILNGSVSVIDALASVPPARVRAVQAAIEATAYRMQYSAVEVPGRVDAFDVTIEHLRTLMLKARS